MIKSTIHSSDTADSPCLLGNMPQPKRPGIKPDLKTAEQPFFLITCLLLLLLFFLLFTTSTHAQLLLTLVLSECVLVRVFVCHFIIFPPILHSLWNIRLNTRCSIHSFFQAGSGSCPGRGGDLLLCYILLAEQKQTNMLIIIFKEASNSCLDLVHQHSKYKWFRCKYTLRVGVSLLTLSEKTKEALAGFESLNCDPLHVADWHFKMG